jgi:hypothetical protein
MTSALNGGWVVSVRPRPRFIPGERTPGTLWTGGWVGPELVWTQRLQKKILCLCWGSNPDCPVVQSVVKHYTELPWLLRACNNIHKRRTRMGCRLWYCWWNQRSKSQATERCSKCFPSGFAHLNSMHDNLLLILA